MNANHATAHILRRQIALRKRAAIVSLILSLIGLAVWELFTGPHPDDFGYRFSPMYSFTWQGFGFWTWVAAVLVSVALINYFWLGREIMIQCPRCAHLSSSKDDWLCADCGKANRPRYGGARDSYFTVLTHCKHCGAAPAAYRCPQCGHVIPLEHAAESTRYAEHAARAAPPAP